MSQGREGVNLTGTPQTFEPLIVLTLYLVQNQAIYSTFFGDKKADSITPNFANLNLFNKNSIFSDLQKIMKGPCMYNSVFRDRKGKNFGIN